MEFEHSELGVGLTDDGVEQMLILAERLREANGGSLDESAIQAVAEATGAPVEYVRLAVKLRAEKEKKSFVSNLRSQYRTLEPHTRRFVLSGAAAASSALLMTADARMTAFTQKNLHADYGIFTMLATITIVLGIYNVFLSRNMKTAAWSGACLTGGLFLMNSVFSLLLGVQAYVDTTAFPMVTIGGALGGVALFKFAEKYRGNLGLKDPAKERQDLLRQLNQLQDRLTSGRQEMTFLSVDIVGSTRMKEGADPLAVEYTFSEYQEFVSRISQKYGGRVHSMAGDGIISAFDHPQQAFMAAKNIHAGLIELNTLRNRIGIPIILRSGIHSGAVIAPKSGDITSVSFSHVIDLASHLQKSAPAGGIAVSDTATSQIAGGSIAVGQDRIQVLDIGATVWRPNKPSSNLVVSGSSPTAQTELA